MNESTTVGIGLVIAAYAAGTIPFGVWFARWAGAPDPRTQGSRNIGGTNVLRVAGKRAGLLTLAADASKGALAVGAANVTAPMWAEAAAVAAVAGHTFPVWNRFRGGKGVATGIGALLMLSPGAGGLVAGIWIAVVAATRYVSLGSVTAAAALPLIAVTSGEARLFAAVVPAIIVVRHWENLIRLRRGTESKLGAKAT